MTLCNVIFLNIDIVVYIFHINLSMWERMFTGCKACYLRLCKVLIYLNVILFTLIILKQIGIIRVINRIVLKWTPVD